METIRTMMAPRSQTVKMKKLLDEYKALKAKLFKGSPFVEPDDDDPDWQRYDQLFGYFYPQYRIKGWKSPM